MKIRISKDSIDERTGFWTVSTTSLRMYEFCKKHKIKIEEPRGEDGLYHDFIIHLTTIEKQILFQARFTDLLQELIKLQRDATQH
jgi:hypothetical protein